MGKIVYWACDRCQKQGPKILEPYEGTCVVPSGYRTVSWQGRNYHWCQECFDKVNAFIEKVR